MSSGFVSIFAVALLSLPSALIGETIDRRFAADQPMVLVSHRALGYGYPENSLAAIKAAMADGIDMIEVDVAVTVDGTHILMHDRTFDRTTNVGTVFPDGPPYVQPFGFPIIEHLVGVYEFEEVQQLSLIGADDATYPIPTLDQVLAETEGVLLDLDVKSFDPDTIGQIIADHDAADRLVVRNPALNAVARLHELTGAAPLHTLNGYGDPFEGLRSLFDQFGEAVDLVEVAAPLVTPELKDLASELGIRLMVLGLSKPDKTLEAGDTTAWESLLSLEAGAYMTDHPQEIRSLTDK